MIKKIKSLTFLEIIFLFILGIQLGFLVYMNIFRSYYLANVDSTAAMAQAMEIWNQKTIFLKDWEYQTVMGLDSTMIVAALLYGICGNIFVSYGLSNLLAVALYVYVFNDIFRKIKIGRLAGIITLTMIFIPYSLETLGYMPLMFTNASFYVIKAFIAVLIIDVMLNVRSNAKVKSYIFQLVLLAVILFLSGMSSGLYILICSILPVFLYEIYDVLTENDIKKFFNLRTAYLFGGAALYCAGIVTATVYGANVFTNDMILCNAYNIIINFNKWIVGIMELFGAISYGETRVLSVEGINYLAHFMGFCLYFICCFMAFKYIKHKKKDNTSHALWYVMSVWFVNTAVLLLTYTTYETDTYGFRYHLIPIVAGFIVFGIGIERFIAYFQANKKTLLSKCACLLAALVILMCNLLFVYYAKKEYNYDVCVKINDVIVENEDAKVLYFVGEDIELFRAARTIRLIAKDRYGVLDGLTLGSITGWGVSTKYHDLDKYDGHIVLVFTNEDYEKISSDGHGQFTYLETVDMYTLCKWNR